MGWLACRMHPTSIVAPASRRPTPSLRSLESWLPGAVAASVKVNAIVSQGPARMGVTLTGIDPRTEARVSKLATQMREGQLSDLSRATNSIIIGLSLAQKLGVGVGNTVLLGAGEAVQIPVTVAGIFRSGLKQIDEGQIYSSVRVAQIIVGQTGLINQLRLRLHDPLQAQKVAAQVEAQIGYKAVSWQEANSDLIGTFAVRDFIMMTVMGAMLLVSSFATYNIISTITYEKRHDIAIMKSLGMREYKVRRIFVIEAAMIGTVGIVFGWVLGYAHVRQPAADHGVQSDQRRDPSDCDLLFGDAVRRRGRHLAALRRRRGILSGAQGDARPSGRDHPGGVVTEVSAAGGQAGQARRGNDHPYARQRHRSGGQEGRVPGDHRAVRLRKVVTALSARPARCADRGRSHYLRPGNLDAFRK